MKELVGGGVEGEFRMAESCPIPRQSDSVRLGDAKICIFNKHSQGILTNLDREVFAG